MQQEAAVNRESQSKLRAEVEQKSQALNSCREEVTRLHDQHKQELGQLQQRLNFEQTIAADTKSLQEKLADATRDTEAEARLRENKSEQMARHVSSLEEEIATMRRLLDAER